jgi:excisionase family DNA binding protein
MRQPRATSTSVDDPIYGPIVSALEDVLNQLPLSAYPALVGELERLKLVAVGRLMAHSPAVNPGQERDLLTIPEVAKRLRISEYRAYELARHGILQSIRLGRSVRVKSSAVGEYLMRQGT